MSSVQSFFPILDPAPSSKPGRKDGSAMFSLGSLIQREAAAPPPSGPAAPAPRSLRSGLIDLSALRERPEVVTDHLAVFPLGAPESRRPAAVASAIAAAPAPARRPIGAMVAAVAIAAAGIGLAAGILRGAPGDHRGPAAMAGVAGVARALPARLPAEPRAEPTPAPVDPGAKPPAPAPPAPTVNAVMPRPIVTARPPAKPPAPPTRPSDPCRGDLMCAMQQAVNKKK